ncbi:sensor histidine kinase [Rosistilla carotiformis]|nr:ATP-binding protein [Rosistilla carotiformis]
MALLAAGLIGLPLCIILVASVPMEYRSRLVFRFVMAYGVIAAGLSFWFAQREARRSHADAELSWWVNDLANGNLASRLRSPRLGDEQIAVVHHLNRLQEATQQQIEQLQADRRRSFMVLAHMVEGIIAIDDTRRVLLVNEAACHFLKLNSETAVGRQLLEVVRVPEVTAVVNQTLATNDDAEAEIQLSDMRQLLVKASTLPSQSRPGVLLTIHDQTHLKQLEAMRREFIANVSHELKTPLAAVKGYAETLQLGAIDDTEMAPHFVNQILAQADRLERLIADMMHLARAQDRSQPAEPTDVPVLPVIQECCETYQPVAAQKNIELTLQPFDESIAILAEREALLTVANNLVGNALRYTPEGGHVTVSCQTEDELVSIAVADDGLGIPLEDQERVFERFYRVEKARDQQYGGTGLGLAIVKNIVQSFGGTMRLKSMPGKGSTFEAVLPASQTAAPQLSKTSIG